MVVLAAFCHNMAGHQLFFEDTLAVRERYLTIERKTLTVRKLLSLAGVSV